MSANVELVSKTLPVGLCCNYVTGEGVGGVRVSICLVSPLKTASLRYCSSASCPCSHYAPVRYGFSEDSYGH